MFKIYSDEMNNEEKIQLHKYLYIFMEFFTETEKGLESGELYPFIFPSFFIEYNYAKCKEILLELEIFINDQFYHELSPIYEYALYNILVFYKEASDPYILDNDLELKNTLYKTFDVLFQDFDFLNVGTFFEYYKRVPEVLEHMWAIDLEQYTDLMPKDIKEQFYRIKEGRAKKSSKTNIDNSLPERKGVVIMNQYINNGQTGAMGDKSTSTNNTFNQNNNKKIIFLMKK